MADSDKATQKRKSNRAVKGLSKAVESTEDSQEGEGTGSHRLGALKAAKRHSESPFVEGLIVKQRTKFETIAAGRKAIVDQVTGEIEDVAEMRKVTVVDADQFVKLFTGELARLFSLSPTGIRLMEPMLSIVSDYRSKNTDTVHFSYAAVEQYYRRLDRSPPGRMTYYRAINELVEKQFVAASDLGAGWFYINPAIFFNGDRIKFTTEIRKRKSKAEVLEGAGQARLEFRDFPVSEESEGERDQ